MRNTSLILVLSLTAMTIGGASAQTPVAGAERSGAPTGFVPGKDQPTRSTVGGADTRAGARNQSDGQVEPPSKIDTGVQVMAPEKKR